MNSTVPFMSFADGNHQTGLATISALLGGCLGFTLIQIGLCRPIYTSSILIHNLVCASIAVISCWSVGYAFCFGTASNPFLSYENFFLVKTSSDVLITWAFHCSSTMLFVTVVNGGFVERMRSKVYVATTIVLSGFIYPIGCHWCWHRNGWLYHGIEAPALGQRIRFIDRGGVAAFHLSAGSIALFAGLFLKPRKARIGTFKLQFVGGQTNINVFIGGLAAAISIMARIVFVNNDAWRIASTNGVVTATTSALVSIMFKRSRIAGENWNTRTLINGAITGLVAVSAKPHNIHPYAAFGLGMVAGITYIAWGVGLKHLLFDDVIDTVAVHFGGGACGIFAAALLDKSEGSLYNLTNESFKGLGWSLVALLAYSVWSGLSICLVLLPFHRSKLLKYDDESEQTQGTDIAIFGEPAYPKAEGKSATKLRTMSTTRGNDVNQNDEQTSTNIYDNPSWSPTTNF